MKFKIGDKVYKPKGYKFDSVIVSVFTTVSGNIRIVAENGDGLLHIFNEDNLELVKEEQNKDIYTELDEMVKKWNDWFKYIQSHPIIKLRKL